MLSAKAMCRRARLRYRLNPTSSSGDLEVTVDEKGGGNGDAHSTVPLLQREGRVRGMTGGRGFRSGNSRQSSPSFEER